MVRHTFRFILIVACLSLIGTLGLIVVRGYSSTATQRKAPAVPTALTVGHRTANAVVSITASNMQSALTAIDKSALTKGHDTTWLITPNGSVKLLQREAGQASLASTGSVARPSGSSAEVLCKGDAFASGSLASGDIEEETFSVAKGSGALTGDFAGNAGAGDKSIELLKGLQYRPGYDMVTIANGTTQAVPFNGYFNLLITTAGSC